MNKALLLDFNKQLIQMKKLLFPLILLFLTTLQFSCSKDDNDNNKKENSFVGIWELTEAVGDEETPRTLTLTLTFDDDNNLNTTTKTSDIAGNIIDNKSINATYEILTDLLIVTTVSNDDTEVESFNYSIEGNQLSLTSILDSKTRIYTRK
jgi:hypothetical protein